MNPWQAFFALFQREQADKSQIQAEQTTLAKHEQRLTTLEKQMTATQSKIDAETAAVLEINTIATTNIPLITAGFQNLETEIAQLKLASPDADFTKLDAAIALTKTGVTGLATIVPADAITALPVSTGTDSTGTADPAPTSGTSDSASATGTPPVQVNVNVTGTPVVSTDPTQMPAPDPTATSSGGAASS